jgi:hypothetical protein
MIGSRSDGPEVDTAVDTTVNHGALPGCQRHAFMPEEGLEPPTRGL